MAAERPAAQRSRAWSRGARWVPTLPRAFMSSRPRRVAGVGAGWKRSTRNTPNSCLVRTSALRSGSRRSSNPAVPSWALRAWLSRGLPLRATTVGWEIASGRRVRPRTPVNEPAEPVPEKCGEHDGGKRVCLDGSGDRAALVVVALHLWPVAPCFLQVPFTGRRALCARWLACSVRPWTEPWRPPSSPARPSRSDSREAASDFAATLFEPVVVHAGGSLAGKLSSTASSTSRCCIFFSSLSGWAGLFGSVLSPGIRFLLL